MSRLELKNITKKFDNKIILDNINLVVEEGEMVSLLGPSGCGKTTTLKIITGLIYPDNGDVLLNNKSVLAVPVEKRETVIVFQDYLLFPHMTVEENIGFGLKMAKVDKKVRDKKVKEMINLVRLNGHEKKYPRELSGGQKQRVALARAIAVEPKVLLLDEPFSNLDGRLRENMREFVCELQKQLKITTILVTHDREEALMTSDKVAVMLEGKIRQFGSPEEIYKKPATKDVADFFGEKNYIKGTIENNIFKSRIGNFKTTFNKFSKGKAMIRPEEIEIFSKDVDTGLLGKIKKKKFAGDRMYYNILINDVEIKCITKFNKNYNVGDMVSVKIDFNDAVFFKEE
ncbi:ABC transporter ATP-binding protein [Thermohalobacter berrensis]|uniref:ABC-type quaternary amine transporter n=1 Tax=Thermohalobacter berrensis TaxID=99594 RepID=A0A419SUY0_9FIRM|nr:ABC transporter ATP-binding protein [Thermohalobacter berrensis]RKD29026.1 ABC transporter ATP-binding protein [Thermohalobacter berrensis]